MAFRLGFACFVVVVRSSKFWCVARDRMSYVRGGVRGVGGV